MIPIEDLTEGWYVARVETSKGSGEYHEWTCVWYDRNGRIYDMGEDFPMNDGWQFHSRIPMPDATPEETPEERKDGE